MNHLVFIIMDSCRYDAVVAARTPTLDALGTVEARWSYASWTAPSHHAMLMGLLPHRAPRETFAAEVYRGDLLRWRDRLDMPELQLRTFVPTLNLPGVLRRAGYRTHGLVSLPVLNPYTTMATGFDEYRLWPTHADFAGMIDHILTTGFDEPRFWFLNLGETHYPYMLDAGRDLPHLSGVHGVFRRIDESDADADAPRFFDAPTLDRLRAQQVRCVEHLDAQFARLFPALPDNTWLIVTADHGELFGEDGYFGHGPMTHPKVFEVPFIEGRVRALHRRAGPAASP
ncbi:MAG: sulfatase-like hydrolase/transferase [Planctomycetota bacterium]